MIAFAKPPLLQEPSETCRERFENMVSTIREKARFAFRRYDPESREDLIQEVVASAWVAYCRLWRQGKVELGYASTLADFAIRQVRAGRRVGTRLNSSDVMSPYAQKVQGFYVTSFGNGTFSSELNGLLTESCRWTPAELACSRIDFRDWLRRLSRARRRIAQALALGESTKAVAERFGVSPGRISQVRRELEAAWNAFQGEASPCEPQ